MSHNLRSLLQDADPVRREAPLPETHRQHLLQKILREAGVVRSRRSVRARFTVATIAMAVVIVVALGYEMWVHGTTAVSAAVRFEVRLAENQAIPGFVVAQVPDPPRVIFLHPDIVVSNEDIAQSWVSQDGPDRFNVTVQLLPSGADRMRHATAMHVGRPMAILIDGRVVMAPVVRSPISDTALITGDFPRAEAERIADGMKLR
jgi:hypothetical protein